jgi:hypothetical protein
VSLSHASRCHRDLGDFKAPSEKPKKPTLTLDQAQAKLEGFLKQKDSPSILVLSGISPEVFKDIRRHALDNPSQFPGFENSRLVTVTFTEVIDKFSNLQNGCPGQNGVFSKE